uniref:V-set and immunoglobulin domain containing 10 n=1 Tax=Phasianus colchicus TaxID=9054 RepID=A0A669PJ27_PHACC
MRFGGGTALAGLLVALCVWPQVPRRSAAGTEVVFGKVGGSILLLCRNVSKEATEVLWFQGDPRSFPPLFSSRVAFPPDVRFSLVDNSSLRISELRLQDEGNYTCKEVLNKTDHEHRVQLLVASKSVPELPPLDPPRSTPKCWAETSSSGLMLQLFCSWPGGYPHPTLHWQEEGHDLENSSWLISSTSSSDTHVETLNSSYLSHRKVFKCVGSHVVKQEEPACSVEIKVPSLELEPPKTCFVGDNVTLTCRVTESVPPARLTWLRGITQPEIEPGGRYFIAQEGNVSHLTIQNCSQGIDGGCYVCKAQNPVGLREVFVCLTVKQPTNIVGVVGAVVVLSLIAVLTISGVVLYYNPLLCLRGRSSPPCKPGSWGEFSLTYLPFLLCWSQLLTTPSSWASLCSWSGAHQPWRSWAGTQGPSIAGCFKYLALSFCRELCSAIPTLPFPSTLLVGAAQQNQQLLWDWFLTLPSLLSSLPFRCCIQVS